LGDNIKTKICMTLWSGNVSMMSRHRLDHAQASFLGLLWSHYSTKMQFARLSTMVLSDGNGGRNGTCYIVWQWFH